MRTMPGLVLWKTDDLNFGAMLNLVTILVIPVLPLSKLTSDSSNDIVIIIDDGVLEH